MIDVNKETTYVASSERLWLMVLLGLLLIAASFAVAWPIYSDMDLFHRLIGWFGVFFFGWCTSIPLIRSLGIDRSSITLSPRGFHASNVSSQTIPWNAVTRISGWSHLGAHFLIVKVTEETWRNAGIRPLARLGRPLNRLIGVDGLAIDVIGMPVRRTELMQTFQEYRKAHRQG